jgi:hypothetical protein
VTRTRSSAKKAGSKFEKDVADYLAKHVDDRIERRTKNGSKDRGDIAGLRHMGERIVIECKDHGGRLEAGPWVNETESERGNDDATSAIVIAKRRGNRDPADQIVLLTLRDLVALVTGERPQQEGS